jgi:hypothetical protein
MLALALGTVALTAQAGKDCSALKSEIEAKFQAKGVKGYSLGIVSKADVGSAKVVGNCEGGAKRVVYSHGEPSSSSHRGSHVAAAAPAPAAHKAARTPKRAKPAAARKTAAPPPIGNY